jgi:chemotaxis signal transduction protein
VVPTLSIEHCFRPTVDDLVCLVDGGECVRVRDAVLPIRRLKQSFAQADGRDDLATGALLVVEAGGRRGCLFVDEIVGRQQLVSRSLGLARAWCAGIAGAAITADGCATLVLDVLVLLNGESAKWRRALLREGSPHPAGPLGPTELRGEQLLVFQLASQQFGLPVRYVRGIHGMIAVTPVPHAPECVRGIVLHAGQCLPVMDLRRRLGLLPSEPGAAACLVVVDIGLAGGPPAVGCIVDSVCAVVTLAAGPLEAAPGGANIAVQDAAGHAHWHGRPLILLDMLHVIGRLGPAQLRQVP